MIDERQVSVPHDGLAHGFCSLNLPREEHAFPGAEGLLHEILFRERALEKGSEPSRCQAVRLDEVAQECGISQEPFAAAPIQPAMAGIKTPFVVHDDLAR